jgi:hypothetical protein
MIRWNWPIEFDDGTPAWLHPEEPRLGDAYQVIAGTQPFGVAMGRGTGGYRGLYVKLCAHDEPRIRNVELGSIRFTDQQDEPTGGTFWNGGRSIRLYRQMGTLIHTYSWPGLAPLGDSPRLVVMSRAQLAAEEQAAAEQAELESNDLYGMF